MRIETNSAILDVYCIKRGEAALKCVLVTGACGGMGSAVVAQLRDAGYTVFAMDITLHAPEHNVIPVKADITSEASLQEAFFQVSSVTDSLHAIIHFAGMYMLDSLVEVSNEAFEQIFNVNIMGAYRVNKTFLPLLNAGSRIVITTSELAPLDPLPFTGLYAITKSALDKYAYALRMELQLLGIRVSVLRPGAVQTGMLGVSTNALDRFCDQTQLYACNAKRFKKIVDTVESRNISPDIVAKKVHRILRSKHPRYVYSLNRNPLLLLLNVLPHRLQNHIIKVILK